MAYKCAGEAASYSATMASRRCLAGQHRGDHKLLSMRSTLVQASTEQFVNANVTRHGPLDDRMSTANKSARAPNGGR
jgi:hypothetical protein